MSPSRSQSVIFRLRPLLALSLLAVGWACGGGDSPTPPTPTPGTLSLALGSNSGSVVATAAGSLLTVPVTITRGGSFSGAVTLEATGAPAGVTTTFTSSSLAAGVTTSTLTLGATSAAAPGTYAIIVRATGTGVTPAATTYSLTVTAQAVPTFTLAAAPGAVSLTAGEAGTSTLTVTRSGGFTGAVTLALEGAPAGVTGAFGTNPLTGTSTALTITTGAATAPGTYPLTVRATGTGVTERTATVTLTVTAVPTVTVTLTSPTSAVSVAQGAQSAAIALQIAKANTTASVALSLDGAPAGVTGAFTPNPAPGATSSLTLAVGAAVTPGTYNLTVRGTVGTVTSSLPLALTVTAVATGDFSLALAPAAATVTAGQSTQSTITITRTGGLTAAVSLTASGLPAGASAAFTPATTTNGTAQLSITTTGATPAGTYTVTVRGNAPSAPERTATFTLTVQAATGGSGNVTWQFCADDRIPLWFAFQDGSSGAWTRVLPSANNTYSFTINGAVGGAAFVTDEGDGDRHAYVFFQTRAELQAIALGECVTNPNTKTVNGTVSGLAPGQSATVNISGGTGTLQFAGPFSITDVDDGTVDLVAARTTLNIFSQSIVPDRFILRRNLNPANGATLPVLDFDGAEAFAPATANYTVANAGADALFVLSGFNTANGATGTFTFGTLAGGGTTRTVYGVPSARTLAGDFHQVFVSASEGTAGQRIAQQFNRELVDRTVTLGPTLSTPTISALGGPYRRLRATGPVQAQYNQGFGVSYTQASTGRFWTITTSSDYLGGAGTYTLDIPDLTGAAGFDTGWALSGGAATTWAVSANRVEGGTGAGISENSGFRSASRNGDVTP